MRLFRAAIALALVASLSPSAEAQETNASLNYSVLVMFVKNSLTALNHGNLTGNYTVLRDLGSPGFRERNSAADLANIFAKHRAQHYDLSPILVAEPQFTRQPIEIQPGRLQLVGFFPTQPQAVRFAVVYQKTEAGWGIDDITVSLAPIDSLIQTAAATAPTAVAQPVTSAQYQYPAAPR